MLQPGEGRVLPPAAAAALRQGVLWLLGMLRPGGPVGGGQLAFFLFFQGVLLRFRYCGFPIWFHFGWAISGGQTGQASFNFHGFK